MSLKKVKIEQPPQSVKSKIKQLDQEHQERLQIFQRDEQNCVQTHHEYKIPYDPPNFRQYYFYPNFLSDYSSIQDYYDFSLINSQFDISLDYCFTQIQKLKINEETVGMHKSAAKNYILEVDQAKSNFIQPPRQKDSLDTIFANNSQRKSDTCDQSNIETKQREDSNQKYDLGDDYIERIYFQRKPENTPKTPTYQLDKVLSEILMDQFKLQQIIPSSQQVLQQQYLQQYEECELESDEEIQQQEVVEKNSKEIVQQFLNRKSSFQQQQSSQGSKQSQAISIEVNNLMLSNSEKQKSEQKFEQKLELKFEEKSEQKSIHSHKSLFSQKQSEQQIFRPAQSEKQQIIYEQKQQEYYQQQGLQSNMKYSADESNQSDQQIDDLINSSLSQSRSVIQNNNIDQSNKKRLSKSEYIIDNKSSNQQITRLKQSTTQSIEFSPLINNQNKQSILIAGYPQAQFNEQLEEFKRQSEQKSKGYQTPNNKSQLIILGEYKKIPFSEQLEEFKRQSESKRSSIQTPRSVAQSQPIVIEQYVQLNQQQENVELPSTLQVEIPKTSSSSSSSKQISQQISQSHKSSQRSQIEKSQIQSSMSSGRKSGQFVTIGDKELNEIENILRNNCKYSLENLSIVDFQMDQRQPLIIKNQKQYLQLIIDAKIAHDKIQNKVRDSLLGEELINKVKDKTNQKIFKKRYTEAQKRLSLNAKEKLEQLSSNPIEKKFDSDSSVLSVIQHIPSASSSSTPARARQSRASNVLVAALQEVVRRPDVVQGFAGKKKQNKKKAPAKNKPSRQPFQQKRTKAKQQPEYIVESSGHIQSFVMESSFVVENTHSSSNEQSFQSLVSRKSLKEIRPYQEFTVEETNQESTAPQRGPPVREIPKFNPSWAREKERNSARMRNEYFRTEDWRKVTDIMPKFYPAETEAGGYKLQVIESARDFKFVLQFTLYSGQVIGPVMCQKRLTLMLGRKPEPYQTDEMMEGLSLYSKIPINRGFCERKESYFVQGKFILANGTRMDIRFQMVFDPREQNNQRKKGRGRQFR